MSDAEMSYDEDRSLAYELERFCASDELSMDVLRGKIAAIRSICNDSPSLTRTLENELHNSSFFHLVCANKRVKLETVEYILDDLPEAAGMATEHFYDIIYCPEATSAYPIHLACANVHCPDSVIELLVEKNPTPLSHLSVIPTDGDYLGVDCGDYNASRSSAGTPLHYYISRKSNVDIDMVKALIEACPGALIQADEDSKYTCLHALLCNPNIRDLYDVAVYIADIAPSVLDSVVGYDEVALHVACSNCRADPKLVEYLLNLRPESIRSGNISGELPLHILCRNKDLEEAVVLEIYRLLIERDPGLPTVQDLDGILPLHLAVRGTSLDLCKLLVQSYPESCRVTAEGELPLHDACREGSLRIVKYLLELWPESISEADRYGNLPLHEAADWDGSQKAQIIEFLLSKDPGGAERATANGSLPLHLACSSSTKSLSSFRVLINANPWALAAVDADGKTSIDLARDHEPRRPGNRLTRDAQRMRASLVKFLNDQLAYLRKAQDSAAMTTLDEHGLLPLHHALRDNATLGAVKLLLKGNSSAMHVPVGKLTFPLHLACEKSTPDVVDYLLTVDESYLNRCDFDQNNPLHYACRGGNLETVRCLLDRHTPSVSERNANDKLPLHVLCEARENINGNERMHVETVWRLLLAHPETCRVE